MHTHTRTRAHAHISRLCWHHDTCTLSLLCFPAPAPQHAISTGRRTSGVGCFCKSRSSLSPCARSASSFRPCRCWSRFLRYVRTSVAHIASTAASILLRGCCPADSGRSRGGIALRAGWPDWPTWSRPRAHQTTKRAPHAPCGCPAGQVPAREQPLARRAGGARMGEGLTRQVLPPSHSSGCVLLSLHTVTHRRGVTGGGYGEMCGATSESHTGVG